MNKNVSVEMLQALIAEAPKGEPQAERTGNATNTGAADGKVDLAGYFDKYGVKVKRVKQHGGATLYVLDTCLFDQSHTGGESAIGQTADGVLFYQCFHNSCKGRTWADARRIISGSDSLRDFSTGQVVAADKTTLRYTDKEGKTKLRNHRKSPGDDAREVWLELTVQVAPLLSGHNIFETHGNAPALQATGIV